MTNELPFDGFKELIQLPLEKSDPTAFNNIKQFLLEERKPPIAPFSTLILRLTGKQQPNTEAIVTWKQILEHKKVLERQLNRKVSIQVVALDFFELNKLSNSFINVQKIASPVESVPSLKPGDEWMERVYTPGYHLEKLKEEMLRSKRYKNALSSILLDVDDFKKINDALTYKGGDQILTLIVKIVKKTIRTVDILSRYSGDRFLLILPNTNKREAVELAERIRDNICQRTKRIEGLQTDVTVTLSVGQCTKDDTSTEFIKKLVSALEDGKKRKKNSVYAII
jgi:diguanylate cyclase (GGDEF)-like protein